VQRSYRLIGMLLDRIASTECPPIVDQDIGQLIRFHNDAMGKPAGVEGIEFDEFDGTCVYEHYLAMLHGGLVFKYESDDPRTGKSNDTVVKLTVKGYEMLDEYKKWTS